MNSKTRERCRQIMQDIEKPSAAKAKQWFDLLWQEDDALDWLKSWEPGAKMRINDETAYGRSSQNNQRRHEQFNPSKLGLLEANGMSQTASKSQDKHSGPSSRGRKLS